MYEISFKKNRISNIFTRLSNEFIYGGHLVSLHAPSHVLTIAILLSMGVEFSILLIAYIIPLIVYAYNYYGELEKDILTNPERAAYLDKKIRSFPYVLGFYIVSLFALMLIFANMYLIYFILALIIGGVLFTVFFKDLTKIVPCFKNIYTSFTWAIAGAFFLLINYSLEFRPFFVLLFLFIFMRSILNVFFFDLKDLEGDRQRGLLTIPVMVGKEKTLKFLHALNLFSFSPIIIGIFIGEIPALASFLLLTGIYAFYYLKRAETTEERELRQISYMIVDSEFIFWPVLLLIGKILLNVSVF
ncbi:prenyltransferase [Methanocella sp. CWC-04]|uniref:Prenyltransferase n=1 Tax=Methanooceanicella nereidis TaxID=2052831 RepID=A0AAP2W3W2_9EURY|nr:UbiA family prenyltransferase [Methanocella sp. CWC-04]MCD1293565.1 prenyltransferase [Methanocella sp. CWC-04]